MQITSPPKNSPPPPHSPYSLFAAAALLRHFAVHLEICALIWRSETETAATATGQDWDSSGTAVDGHRRKEIERKAGSQQLATGRVDKANFSSWAN